jgi:Undecaprenyl-phosphate glucose phosphotransferase
MMSAVTTDPPETGRRNGRGSPLAEVATAGEVNRAVSPLVLAGLVRFTEFCIIVAAGALVHFFYVVPIAGFSAVYYAAISASALLAVILYQALGLYKISAFRSPAAQGLKLSGALGLVFLAGIAVFFMAKQGEAFSRVWMVTWYFVSIAGLAIERMFVSIFTIRMTRAGLLDRRTVIVGADDAGRELLDQLTRQQDTDIRILGLFDDRTDERTPDVVAGYPRLGTVEDLVEFARHTRVDLVIFALPITAEQRILQMLRKLWVLPLDIRLAAHSNKLRFQPRSYSYIGAVPVLDIFDKPIAGWDVVLKLVFDKIFGSLFLLLLSPLMLLIALAIKLDSPGRVLFRQKRYGFNNELIEVFKFRSMYEDELDARADKLVTRGDPRVTRVGRFIRRTSLDELPQLFNVVFKGDLSLVGPRPHAVHAKAADRQYDEVVEGYFARHRVRPGITGWAQVNGWRGETDTPEKLQFRVEHDLYYIENWSLMFDIYILAITPFALIKADNAY